MILLQTGSRRNLIESKVRVQSKKFETFRGGKASATYLAKSQSRVPSKPGPRAFQLARTSLFVAPAAAALLPRRHRSSNIKIKRQHLFCTTLFLRVIAGRLTVHSLTHLSFYSSLVTGHPQHPTPPGLTAISCGWVVADWSITPGTAALIPYRLSAKEHPTPQDGKLSRI